MIRRAILSLVLMAAILVSDRTVAGQTPDNTTPDDATPSRSPESLLRGEGSQPFEPFRVIGNIYYVGAVSISSYIIATDEGLILLDTGTVEMLPGLRANIEKIGFRLQDIKIILSSHAHWDHVESHAMTKELTGARVIALGEDATAIAAGIDNSALGGTGWKPTEVDRILKDGDSVTLGDVTMQAHLTAGHTKGCTTWTIKAREGQDDYLVVFVGGTSINPAVKLLENARHPGIAKDYARTFALLKELRADVFLAQHPAMYDMAEKRQRMKDGARRNPFVDPKGYQRFVAEEEGKFVAQLQQETAEQ